MTATVNHEAQPQHLTHIPVEERPALTEGTIPSAPPTMDDAWHRREIIEPTTEVTPIIPSVEATDESVEKTPSRTARAGKFIKNLLSRNSQDTEESNDSGHVPPPPRNPGDDAAGGSDPADGPRASRRQLTDMQKMFGEDVQSRIFPSHLPIEPVKIGRNFEWQTVKQPKPGVTKVYRDAAGNITDIYDPELDRKFAYDPKALPVREKVKKVKLAQPQPHSQKLEAQLAAREEKLETTAKALRHVIPRANPQAEYPRNNGVLRDENDQVAMPRLTEEGYDRTNELYDKYDGDSVPDEELKPIPAIKVAPKKPEITEDDDDDFEAALPSGMGAAPEKAPEAPEADDDDDDFEAALPSGMGGTPKQKQAEPAPATNEEQPTMSIEQIVADATRVLKELFAEKSDDPAHRRLLHIAAAAATLGEEATHKLFVESLEEKARNNQS